MSTELETTARALRQSTQSWNSRRPIPSSNMTPLCTGGRPGTTKTYACMCTKGDDTYRSYVRSYDPHNPDEFSNDDGGGDDDDSDSSS